MAVWWEPNQDELADRNGESPFVLPDFLEGSNFQHLYKALPVSWQNQLCWCKLNSTCQRFGLIRLQPNSYGLQPNSNLVAMASNLVAMASTLGAMVSDRVAMASNLVAMAST